MNLRPLRPERSALAKLSYSPAKQQSRIYYNNFRITVNFLFNMLRIIFHIKIQANFFFSWDPLVLLRYRSRFIAEDRSG